MTAGVQVTASLRSIAVRAFSSPEWRAASDALFQATGVTLSVMDFDTCDLLAGDTRCGYCHLATEISGPGPLTCFDTCPDPRIGVTRIMCRAGLPTLVAPVQYDGYTLAHVVLGGFVTSTRERRRVYEQMVARSTNVDSARLAVKALMVVSRRQAEGYLQMALATGNAVVAATADRMASADRVEELRLFVSAGQQVVTTERLDAPTLGAFTEEAIALVCGEAGAVLRPHGTTLEVTARTEGWRGALGVTVPQQGTAAGRACTTGRAVVSPSGGSGTATLALPLALSGTVLGVLEVRLPASVLPLSPERLARLDRFGRFIAIALAREDERTQVERAMAGYAQLNELAATLGGLTDIDGIAGLLTSVIDKSFTFDVAGLVISSWGRDHAEAVVCGDVGQTELDWVISEVAGRDVAAEPFSTNRVVTHRGAIIEGGELRPDWALSSIELEYGDLEVGYLFVARADGARYGAQDRALLEGIAAHAGAALGRAALFSHIRDDYAKTIAALSATLDAGERMPSGHSARVMDYAIVIGEELGLSFEDIESLRFAGLLHDIGKTGVPEEILLKPSKLSPEERVRVESHAELGASIVDQIDFLKSITPIILHHHERWDGKGYPHRLAGESIPLLARILAVADSYDAMTTTRPHHRKLTIAEARSQLELGAGTQFDPRVVAALFEALDRMALVGSTGLLSSITWKGRPELLA